jgi:hypothetical protein
MPPEHPGSQPSPIPAARSRELPDRTIGGETSPAPADARVLPRLHGGAGSGKTRSRWRRRQAAAGARRERCLWKIPRYAPSRKPATARRQAPQRRTRGAACNQIRDEPEDLSHAEKADWLSLRAIFPSSALVQEGVRPGRGKPMPIPETRTVRRPSWSASTPRASSARRGTCHPRGRHPRAGGPVSSSSGHHRN